MFDMKLDNWLLCAVLQYQPFYSPWVREGVNPTGETPWIKATVPGSVYRDLMNAGIIEDPYYGLNSLSCEWVANRWWSYKTTFTLTEEEMQKPLAARFEGVDYKAHVYLNGKELMTCEGMYIPFEAGINGFLKPAGEENVLVCVLENAPQVHPQGGVCSETHYLKARFNYRWDFCTRLVNLGLYGRVHITEVPEVRFENVRVTPVKQDGKWFIEACGDCKASEAGTAVLGLSADIDGRSVAFSKLIHVIDGYVHFKHRAQLPTGCAPRLWQPNGLGGQPLYEVRLKLSRAGKAMDEFIRRVGFRTVEYVYADGREDALPYNAVINGRRVYLKGSNYVPADCMTGSDEHVRATVYAAKEANLNFFRVWGGGHIEGEAFYTACDECGIMVLQEFPMSSAGCDDVPSRDPFFLKKLSEAAKYNCTRLASHPSILFFDGGNELTDARYEWQGRPDHEAHPVGADDPTIALLTGIAAACCPGIQFLPSSASGPRALLDPKDTGNNHDVHGPWHYAGLREHYELFNSSDSIVHGEFGCGGMAGMEQLRRVLPESELKLSTNLESRVWAHHSSGWDSYERREKQFFGDLRALPLEDYIKVNQFIQWEALRYALEANRRRLWQNVGEMTWQFNEPWPNVQCSNVLEYYGGRKLGYYALKEAYRPTLLSFRYDSLTFTGSLDLALFLTREGEGGAYSVTVTVTGENGSCVCEKTYEGEMADDVSVKAGTLTCKVPDDCGAALTVTARTTFNGETTEKRILLLRAQEGGHPDTAPIIRFWDAEMRAAQ